ncbi:MAG: hypothetical protein Q4A97_05960, partial [Comamonadaceae bacterium]|nr:hypothetical protein [Comamonadaceae bacterium]
QGTQGGVEIGFAKRFFEAKAAVARRKRAQGLDSLHAFSTQPLRSFDLTESTAATLNLNNLKSL